MSKSAIQVSLELNQPQPRKLMTSTALLEPEVGRGMRALLSAEQHCSVTIGREIHLDKGPRRESRAFITNTDKRKPSHETEQSESATYSAS